MAGSDEAADAQKIVCRFREKVKRLVLAESEIHQCVTVKGFT